MAKAVKVVGVVVAVVAVAAAIAVTAGAGATVVAGMTVSSIAAGAAAASAAIAIGSQLAFKPKFNTQGTALDFQTNPQSGLPYAIGRTRMSGLRIYAETNSTPGYSKAEDLLWFAALLSAGGAIDSIQSFTADKAAYTFDGSGQTTGDYASWMAQKVHLGGAQASGLALALNGGSPPGWTTAHKLSGITHAMWGLRYDKDGKKYGAGVPEPSWVGKWVKAYDPRKDSTYPGGSGTHRALNESTYEWTANPALHALTWALGRWQNSKRTLGIGAPVANIRVADFVEAANVADTNGWTCGGVEWSTDAKWDVLKRMLQAGGAVPTMTGAMIGCRVRAPRVSILTIQANELLDQLKISTTRGRRDRYNTVLPRYTSESHEWEAITGSAVAVSAYVTADGGPRTKEIDYPLVQQEGANVPCVQAGQLAAYDIVDSREAGPISFAVGPKYIGLKTGDCITLNVPDEGLTNQMILIREVSVDPSTTKVTITADTETTSKHAFALGQSTTPPPPFTLVAPDLTPPTPTAPIWTLTGGLTGDGLPAIAIAGASEYPGADVILIQYRKVGAADWETMPSSAAQQPVSLTIAPLESATSYEARVAYQSEDRVGEWLVLATVMTGTATVGQDGTYAWTPVFDPTQWRREGGTITRLVAGWDLTKPITSLELMPLMAVSWTITNLDKRQVLGLKSAAHAYTLFTQGTGGVLEWVTDPVAVGLPRGTIGAYSVGQRLTVAHRGSYIQALVNGVEVYRWTGIAPTEKFQLYGMAADVGAPSTFGDIAVTVIGDTGTDGEPGADGVDGIDPVNITAKPDVAMLSGTAAGVVQPGQLPFVVANTAFKGGAAIAVTSVTSVAAVNCTVSIVGANVSITAVSGLEGSITYDVLAGGQTIRKQVNFQITAEGSAGGASVLRQYTTPQITSSTYVSRGPTVAINASPTGKLQVSASIKYKTALGGLLICQAKIQYRPSGGSWTDVSGSETTGTASEELVDPPIQTTGTITIAAITIAGLTADGPYEVQIVDRKTNAAYDASASNTTKMLVEPVA